MDFTPIRPPIENTDVQPGVMHISGPTSSRLRWVIRWILLIAIAAGMMVGLFMKFGATAAWAFCLVGFMLTYMLIMGRWASNHHH